MKKTLVLSLESIVSPLIEPHMSCTDYAPALAIYWELSRNYLAQYWTMPAFRPFDRG